MRRLHSQDDLVGIPDKVFCQVIRQRFTELAAYEDFTFDKLAEFWLVEPGDTVADLEAATGMPIAHGWCNDARYPDPNFSPSWEVLEAHPTSYEMVFVTNDAGYGVVLWIPVTGCDDLLLRMCVEYACLAPSVESITDVVA